MNVDLQGRVSKLSLPKKQGLLPVFEAIVNSIQAIYEANQKSGKIKIEFERDRAQAMISNEDSFIQNLPIRQFTITDNGVGFNKDNFASFITSDSMYKSEIGGKGVGRLLWLKAFNSIEVSSVFLDGKRRKKADFRFSFIDDPEKNCSIVDTDENTPCGTVIKLIGFTDDYALQTVRKTEAIAKYVVEHCLRFFMLDKMPQLEVIDKMTGESKNANVLYQTLLKQKMEEKLEISKQPFNLTHVMFQASSGIDHKISYCGHDRVVEEKPIKSSEINGLTGRLKLPENEDEAGLIYVACVSGEYLDKHISDDRTKFNFPKEDELTLGVSFDKIQDSILDPSRKFLNPYTEVTLRNNRERIEKFIQEDRPKYRALAKHHNDKFDAIPVNATGDKLDLELYKIDLEVGYQLRQQAEQIISGSDPKDIDNYSDFFEEFGEYGRAQLADYISHRHAVLRLLGVSLAQNESGKYAPEKVVHDLIFPMGKTSDDVGPDEHNLWIIDEKLAYHYYLASDTKINKLPINANAKGEPDLIVFNRPIAIVSESDPPYQSVVIFEFKKPMRDDYKEGTTENYKDNPVEQVNRYVVDILDGDTSDHKGRPFNVQDGTPFYCYVTADLTKSLRSIIKGRGFTPTPDGLGYFFYNSQLNSYTEVFGYDKLMKDAKNRNRVLFDKLKLPFF